MSIAQSFPAATPALHQPPQEVVHRSLAAASEGGLFTRDLLTTVGKPIASVRILSSPRVILSSPKDGAEDVATLLPVLRQPDILPEDQVFLDRVLRAVPALCRDNLLHLVVRYPSTRLGAGDTKVERGQATATTMILRGPLHNLAGRAQQEMIAVIFHECGHIADLGGLTGNPASGESAFPDGHVPSYKDDPSVALYALSYETPERRKEEAQAEDFASGYAMRDAFEDTAELITLFALHERALRERALRSPVLAAKVAWVEKYFFPEGNPFPEGEPWDGTIPWDVTKLEHGFTLTPSPYDAGARVSFLKDVRKITMGREGTLSSSPPSSPAPFPCSFASGALLSGGAPRG